MLRLLLATLLVAVPLDSVGAGLSPLPTVAFALVSPSLLWFLVDAFALLLYLICCFNAFGLLLVSFVCLWTLVQHLPP